MNYLQMRLLKELICVRIMIYPFNDCKVEFKKSIKCICFNWPNLISAIAEKPRTVLSRSNNQWPRGLVVSALTSHVRGAGFDSRPG